MTADIARHSSRCLEQRQKSQTLFENMFDNSNIVDQIEKELWGFKRN